MGTYYINKLNINRRPVNKIDSLILKKSNRRSSTFLREEKSNYKIKLFMKLENLKSFTTILKFFVSFLLVFLFPFYLAILRWIIAAISLYGNSVARRLTKKLSSFWEQHYVLPFLHLFFLSVKCYCNSAFVSQLFFCSFPVYFSFIFEVGIFHNIYIAVFYLRFSILYMFWFSVCSSAWKIGQSILSILISVFNQLTMESELNVKFLILYIV